MRVLAVDWSGRVKGEQETVWTAEVRDGELTRLFNGRSRAEVIAHLVDLAGEEQDLVVGLDFAFSFPCWWCEQQGWTNVEQIWTAMNDRGERLLEACEPPFWGRPGKRKPKDGERGFRRTERECGGTAKSVFQIGGAGAVGTGSIRGMPFLLTLLHAGFDVWPFSRVVDSPRVVEIYPRELTGKVKKGRWRERLGLLEDRFRNQPKAMIERAVGSEDAFDAAVSALVMAEHAAELTALVATNDPYYAIEGRIWRPGGAPAGRG